MSSCYWLRFLYCESCRFHLVKLTWRYCHLDQHQISRELQLQLTYFNNPRWSQLYDEEDNLLQRKYSVNNGSIVLLIWWHGSSSFNLTWFNYQVISMILQKLVKWNYYCLNLHVQGGKKAAAPRLTASGTMSCVNWWHLDASDEHSTERNPVVVAQRIESLTEKSVIYCQCANFNACLANLCVSVHLSGGRR